jgi:hypothetical protein
VAERRDSVVQVRSVILIALLAVVRKLIILDLSSTDAFHLLALDRSHPRAGRRLLAGARPTAAARNHRGGRRMRLHCKAVATKADKTSSNSKFLA